jgi:hypothetical protein
VFKYLAFDINDMPQENLLLHMEAGLNFIKEALSQDAVILVHW